jgi:hypothetical protein
MRDFAEIWGNASDHEMNNLSSWGKKSAPDFSSEKIPLKIEGDMEKASDPRSAILNTASYQITFE